MSRIPARTSRTPLKPPSTPTRARLGTPSTPSQRAPISRSSTPTKQSNTEEVEKKAGLSIKEAIALRRAEAKKAQTAAESRGLDDFGSLEDALPTTTQPADDDDLLGRLPLRETIEKSRSTGSLNLATRSLACLPSALFEIHLNVTPNPLKSVPNEPRLPEAEPRRGGKRDAPAWFEAQDLTVLKAGNNDIAEIQHEISMFGSLKVLDLHKNKIISLPKTIADLSFLNTLDLSHNGLTEVPENLWSLPELTTLNLSHNQLTSLCFSAPFASSKSRTGPNSYASTDFFAPAVVRSATPLPKLLTLDVSHNQIQSSAVDLSIPDSIVKINFSGNPVGHSAALLRKLATLPRLKELLFEKSEIGNDSIQSELFPSPPFPALKILDLSETGVTLDAVSAFSAMKQEISHDFSLEPPADGVARILVGKRVLKEAWEIELERRTQERSQKGSGFSEWDVPEPTTRSPPPNETSRRPPPRQGIVSKKEAAKEPWEIEAEQGLFTEGARRRARALAAQAQAQSENSVITAAARIDTAPAAQEPTPTSTTSSINNSKYYSQKTDSLTLPASSPAPKVPGHSRAFSVASPASSSGMTSSRGSQDITLPAPTLPLSIIVAQPFASTLKVLVLSNRRLDRCFLVPSIPSCASPYLPNLEELNLEGCNLEDQVAISIAPPSELTSLSGTATPPRSSEPILPTIAKLFPSLRTLNLSFNRLSDGQLSQENLLELLLQTSNRAGLRHLRLRGNKLSELTGFQKLAEMFKGNRDVFEWKLEELDLRDNEVGKLPPELGLLPLDVFLVDGNTFRVPQRRIWEREGTKGLLSWLRGRLE